MKALLVYARFPITYWGFQYGLPMTGTVASLPPLGLVTLAGALPSHWQLRLVDLNVRDLNDADLDWAEVVMIGGMLVQRPSMLEVLERVRVRHLPVVVGGPATSSCPEAFGGADLIFVGEAEGRVAELGAEIEALVRVERGPVKPRVLRADGAARPAMSGVPMPRYDLLELGRYASMSLQYSRGCPFSCEFCDVIELFGRVPRVKGVEQLLGELTELYRLGFRGTVFLVDDNFIGNKRSVKELLGALERWQQSRGRPFEFYTEASVNLASDPDLLAAMVRAGFTSVFLGIETPSRAALSEAGKTQNAEADLGRAVATITEAGLEVMGGFIVGFDHDDPSVFELQRAFISAMPIPLAMVGVLMALPGTALWRRLDREGRLCTGASGDQFGRPNFVPRMDERELLEGYARLLGDLYSADAYLERCLRYIDASRTTRSSRGVHSLREIGTLFRTVWSLGIRGTRRRHFWRLLGYSLRHAPHTFSWAVGHAIQGEHMVRYTEEDVLPRLHEAIAEVTRRGHTSRPRLAPARAA
jgi:radical SAM superfamily enzyme YgiQ (UPF0313 family)